MEKPVNNYPRNSGDFQAGDPSPTALRPPLSPKAGEGRKIDFALAPLGERGDRKAVGEGVNPFKCVNTEVQTETMMTDGLVEGTKRI